jgi:hypothetical protein
MHSNKLDTNFLQWKSATIICDIQQWNALIGEAIIPFLKETINTKWLHAYYINFHYSVGNFTRLAFLMHATDDDVLTQKMHTSLKAFLSTHCSTQDADQLIHYETFNKIEKTSSPGTIRFEQKATDIILDALVNDEISEEILFTLVYQLHLVLIKALLAFTQTDLAFFERIYNHTYTNRHLVTVSNEFTQSLFEKDEDFYYETAIEIFNHDLTDKGDEIPQYILHWYAACIEEINRLHTACGSPDIQAIHRYITFQVNQQCGLTQNVKSLINYFVCRVLSRLRSTV